MGCVNCTPSPIAVAFVYAYETNVYDIEVTRCVGKKTLIVLRTKLHYVGLGIKYQSNRNNRVRISTHEPWFSEVAIFHRIFIFKSRSLRIVMIDDKDFKEFVRFTENPFSTPIGVRPRKTMLRIVQ